MSTHGARTSILGLAVFTLFALTGGLYAQPQAGIEKSVLVSVVSDDPAPLTDLTTADFRVLEDNVARPVVDARLASDPLFVALLVDTAKPMLGVTPPTQEIRRGLTTFSEILDAADATARIALFEFGGAAMKTLDFSTPALLASRIERLIPDQRSGAVLFEAFVDASRSLSEKPGPRRALVCINFSAPETSTVNPKKVLSEVEKSGATAWAVSIQDVEGTSSVQTGKQGVDNRSAPDREAFLNTVTQATGGLRIRALEVSAIEKHLKTVANALVSQYVVSYTRPAGASVKKISLELARPGKVLMSPWIR
jgi:hypothetical protein